MTVTEIIVVQGFIDYCLELWCKSFLILYLSSVHRVVVQGQGIGPRYGHVMDLVAQRYLVTVSGNDGECNA